MVSKGGQALPVTREIKAVKGLPEGARARLSKASRVFLASLGVTELRVGLPRPECLVLRVHKDCRVFPDLTEGRDVTEGQELTVLPEWTEEWDHAVLSE